MKRNLKFFTFILMGLFCLVNIPRVMAQYTSSNKVCTKVGDTEEKTPCQGPGNFVYYCQGGPPWGQTCSLGKAGCGPTSVAMIMSSFGVPLIPPEVNTVFLDNHWRASCSEDAGSDASAAIHSSWFKSFGFSNRESVAEGSNFDYEAAKSAIKDGYILLGSSGNFPCANCIPGTNTVDHIFVIDSIDESNTISIRDPNNCDYMPGGDGLERQTHRFFPTGSITWSWNYAIPIKKTS